jgi:hypothetical protein
MRGYVLQDWVTIRGSSSTLSVAQPTSDYLDLGPFEDAVVWLEVSEVTTGGVSFLSMAFESAPIREDAFFTAQGGYAPTIAIAEGVAVAPIVLDDLPIGQLPIARWLRWKITSPGGGGSSWSVTFRAVVAAHTPCG